MSTEIIPLAGIRHNGELDLTGVSDRDLAGMVDDLQVLKSRTREYEDRLSIEIHRRMDRNRLWTIHTEDGLTLKGKSDAPDVRWDVEGLNRELAELEAEGLISLEAWGRAVSVTEVVKARTGGLNALLKNPEIAERLAPFRREVPLDTRRVSVSRA